MTTMTARRYPATPEGPADLEAAIAVTDLVVCYGARRAVDGLSLRVPRGAVYGLVGANGAGKTTLIKALLGFHAPTGGSIRVLGYAGGREQLAMNARVGFVSETNTLYPHLSVPQLCAFFRATALRWDAAAVERYLRLFGLPAEARVRQLSKGMRTQLALCLALGSWPDLLILDEPTTGLDPVARRAFLDVLIGEVAAAGRTVFFSSHVLSDVEEVADHVGVLHAGKLVVSEELDVLKGQHAVVRLAYAEPASEGMLAALRGVRGVARVDCDGRGVRVRLKGDVAGTVDALRAVMPGAIAADVSYLSLEDIVLSLLQEGHP
jgi:ABC-2 type transport system ATP-binding protein